jgi:hypothetical protein
VANAILYEGLVYVPVNTAFVILGSTQMEEKSVYQAH